MNKQKVIYELEKRTADPFEVEQCKTLINTLENKSSRMGKIIMALLEYAEHGNFK